MKQNAQSNLDRAFPNGVPFAVKFAIDDAIKEAKKEVFDDIEEMFSDGWMKEELREFNKLKKRHLSTFAKQKQHNNDFKEFIETKHEQHWKRENSSHVEVIFKIKKEDSN